MKESAVSEPVAAPATTVQQLHAQQDEILPGEVSSSFVFQPKLTVGSPDDPLEKEADDIADRVVRMPESTFIQRKCAHCEEEEKISRKETSTSLIQRQDDTDTSSKGSSAPPRLPFHLLNPADLQLRVPTLPRINLYPTGVSSAGVGSLSLTGGLSSPSTSNAIDWFAMNRPFWNRSAGQISDGDAREIEMHWNYSFQMFRSIGATPAHATFFSNLLVPIAIDSSLQRDYSTWWERTDRELNTSSKILSPTILRFDLDNLFGTIRPFWDPSNPYQIQRKGKNGSPAVASETTSNVINSTKHEGDPIPEATRTFMESRFGYDFSDVKVHAGSNAADMSRNLNAKAFTVGKNIYFNQGTFSPDTLEGKHLLAHELTHTLQQSGGNVKLKSEHHTSVERWNSGHKQSFLQCKLQQGTSKQDEAMPSISQHHQEHLQTKSYVSGFLGRVSSAPPDNPESRPTSPLESNQLKEDDRSISQINNLQFTFLQRKCSACEKEEKIQRKEEADNPIITSSLANQPITIQPGKSQRHIQRNVITSALGDAWDATGGRVVSAVGDAASAAVEWVEDRAESIINRIAPGLLDFLRGDIVENIKNLLARAVDAATGGLFSRLQAEGLQGVLEEFVSSLIDTVSGGVERGCQAFAILAQKILDFIRMLGGAALQRIRSFFQRVGGLLSSFWNNFALPIWDAIKSVAGTVWDWITSTAEWLWELIRPIRETIARAWNWLMRQFGIAWRAGGSVLDWIKGKAQQAWNWLMELIEPIKTPLMVIGGILLMLSPLGPIVAIGAGAYAIYRGIQWVRANWNSEVFVRFRTFLKENVLDVISNGIESLKNTVVGAFSWLASTLLSLQAPIVSLLESIGAIAVFRFIQRGIQSFANLIIRAVNWASVRLAEIGRHIINVARDIWEFIRPYAIIVAKLTFLAINPWLIPIVVAAWAWRVLPDCFKPPIIDFVLQIMISTLRNMPDFKLFGETWVQIKQQIIQFLQRQLATEVEQKIMAANRIARMVSELDLELISNQIQAVRQMPGEFEGQMEEELLGADLTAALPFERTEEPTLLQQVASSGIENQIAAEDMRLFQKSTYTESDIGVDRIGEFEPEPELIQSILQRAGSNGTEVEFGDSSDSSRSISAILSGMLPQDQFNTGETSGQQSDSSGSTVPEEGETEGAASTGLPLSREEETEQRLQAMISQSEQNMMSQACDASPQSTQSAEPAAPFPESAKFGPLTRSQRARYTLSQMWTGIRRWYTCNRYWLLPSIIGAIVLLVVAEVLSGGAVTAALPVIMQALTTIMIGVAVVRGAYYVGEYVYKSIAGDIIGAAKALARSIAVAAVELIFALLGSSAFWKSLKSGAASLGRVVGRVGQAIGRVLPAAGRAGKAVLSSVHAVIERGRLIMRGVGARIGRGVRTVDEFAQRLFSRLRFRRFRIRFQRGWFRLEGYINPWVLLATGRVVEVDESAIKALQTGGNKAVLGRSIRVEGVRGVVIGAERDASRLTQLLQSGERAGGRALEQNAALFEDIASRGLIGSTEVYSAATRNIIQHSTAAQALLRNGVPISRVEGILQNALRHAGADANSILSRLERLQRYNVQTFDRILAELSHPQANKYVGAEWALEYLSRQSNTFLAGIEGFELVGTGRRMDIIINGIGYEFKNWGDLRNISGLVQQMAADFQAGTGLSRFRYVFSPRAGETSGIITAITARLADHFTPQQINLITSQLPSIIVR